MELTSNYKVKDLNTGNRVYTGVKTEQELYEAYLHNMSVLNALMMPAGIVVPIL